MAYLTQVNLQNIPRVLYSGHLCDCFIGRIKKVYSWERDGSETFVELEFVKALTKGTSHTLYLDKYAFSKFLYDEFGWEIGLETYVPTVGRLIQVLVVDEGYGCNIYINLLDDIEDAVAVPDMYHELVNARTDIFQI